MSASEVNASRSTARYGVAVTVTVGAIISQYFVPQLFPATRVVYGNLLGDVLVAYGIPIVTFAFLVGSRPLRGWRRQMEAAAWQGFRWYGAMLTLALAVTIALVIVYLAYDPSALGFLDRPNPALQLGASDPWFFVGFSFVVAAAEETLFRGWIFGYWLGRTAGWVGPAVGTSVLFAAMHLYYGVTYGPAAPLIFPTLFLTGFAFAAAFQASRGNLVVISALHGATDAAAYLTLVSVPAGLAVRYGLLAVGLAVLLADTYARRARGILRLSQDAINDPPLPWRPIPSPGPFARLQSGMARSVAAPVDLRAPRRAVRHRHVTDGGRSLRCRSPTTR